MTENQTHPAFKITGIDRAGKRFKILTSNFQYMRGINVWQGTKWVWNPEARKWEVWQRIHN